MRDPARKTRRAGFSMIAVLALIAMAAGMFVSWTRDTVRRDHACRTAHESAQARWIADSALARASAQLRSNDGYTGETWRLTANQLSQSYDAEVVITVESAEQDATVAVQVSLPPGDTRRVLHSQTLTIPNPSAEEN